MYILSLNNFVFKIPIAAWWIYTVFRPRTMIMVLGTFTDNFLNDSCSNILCLEVVYTSHWSSYTAIMDFIVKSKKNKTNNKLFYIKTMSLISGKRLLFLTKSLVILMKYFIKQTEIYIYMFIFFFAFPDRQMLCHSKWASAMLFLNLYLEVTSLWYSLLLNTSEDLVICSDVLPRLWPVTD